MSSEPPCSFYGVYDGHAGKDAAAFAASHLHGLILDSSHFPEKPVEAIKEAFNRADKLFLEKGEKEVIFFIFEDVSFPTLCISWPPARPQMARKKSNVI